MKYFKITDLDTMEAWYVSSTLPNETPGHVALSAHLDTSKRYQIKEVKGAEFYGLATGRDADTDDDWEDQIDERYY